MIHRTRRRDRRTRILLLAAYLFAIVAAFVIGALPKRAESQGDHDLYHAQYENWQRPDGKGSCCNNYDCRPVQMRNAAGGIEVQIKELGNTWHRVPQASVLPFGSFNADAHACYTLVGCASSLGCRVHFYCVALPFQG